MYGSSFDASSAEIVSAISPSRISPTCSDGTYFGRLSTVPPSPIVRPSKMSSSTSPVIWSTLPISLPSESTTLQPRSITRQETRSAMTQTALPPMYQTGPCVPTVCVSESASSTRTAPGIGSLSSRTRQRRTIPGAAP